MNFIIVSLPDVVTVGLPVVVPLYFAVSTLNITTPEPPSAASAQPYEPFPPPPPPVLTVPSVGNPMSFPPPFPPPPAPPVPIPPVADV